MTHLKQQMFKLGSSRRSSETEVSIGKVGVKFYRSSLARLTTILPELNENNDFFSLQSFRNHFTNLRLC